MRGSRTASSDMSAWCSAVVLLSLILLLSVRENNASNSMRGSQFSEKPCEEIYVVGEGETLHTIGDKCGDPFIVERNPHIHDPDDVFPGLVLRIAPFYFSRKVAISKRQVRKSQRLYLFNRRCIKLSRRVRLSVKSKLCSNSIDILEAPCVFWDMDDFTLPPGLDVDQFVKNVCLAISNEGVRGDVDPSPLLQLKLSVNVQGYIVCYIACLTGFTTVNSMDGNKCVDLCSESTSVHLSSAILLLIMIPEAAHQKLIVQTCSRCETMLLVPLRNEVKKKRRMLNLRTS
ncbi:hypothetical protein HID58_095811 [Brassica napus]|uniref:LysM domain-containing protein n=2 Tax=Brassica TaxID=3705 RepID=A0ABQ7X2A6_BRANA|nr:hypothetical protein HID58_095811 [Brassica napus]